MDAAEPEQGRPVVGGTSTPGSDPKQHRAAHELFSLQVDCLVRWLGGPDGLGPPTDPGCVEHGRGRSPTTWRWPRPRHAPRGAGLPGRFARKVKMATRRMTGALRALDIHPRWATFGDRSTSSCAVPRLPVSEPAPRVATPHHRSRRNHPNAPGVTVIDHQLRGE